ncbi:hypothetical protein Nepgr_024355 [Nepenthes gracilis]|uniref:AT-hook motif nuclear-localized protein n=1 Tax=Nepenthes gracilis TaxID=150966 RepID=A0AAD3XYI6_NEPGR|nr:hypothetical protein Nepgr_024355 [Nepenthes gracilis]
MEAKENITSGVTVIRAEAPSNYHVAPRSDAPGQVTVSQAMALTPMSADMAGVMEKKKRGRPRKYGPDGMVNRALSPMPISASAPPSTAKFPGWKRGRGRTIFPETDPQHGVNMGSMGEGAACTGAHFTPHVITVCTGEDVTAKIISFCQQGPRAICVLSASGVISNATLRQSASSGGTLTYEGRFEIVKLSGSFTPSDSEGARHRTGGLSVSLSSLNGQVVGGCIAGVMVAASPVQVIVGSFLPSNLLEPKPKKQKARPAHISTMAPPDAAKQDSCNGQEQSNSGSMMPNQTPSLFQRENWPGTYDTMQYPRTSTTDINISLPGGMQ